MQSEKPVLPIYGLSDYEFASHIKHIKRAIIPVGSLEQHGSHLPVSTDSLIAEFIARQVAENIYAFVVPVVPFGVSFEHKPMFNISVQSSTLTSLLSDICISLVENGVEEVIILNGHHGNMGVLQYISQIVSQKMAKQARIEYFNYWHMLKNAEFDHAGEVETSLVLVIAPELVRMDLAKPNSKKLLKSKPAYSSITSSPGSFPKITGNGVWGDPTKANYQKGKKLMEEIVTNLTYTIVHELGADEA